MCLSKFHNAFKEQMYVNVLTDKFTHIQKYSLVVVEEIPPVYVKRFEYPKKRYINVTLLLLLYSEKTRKEDKQK